MVQKYLHDLTRWNSLSTEAQERIMGRTKLSDIELDDSVKPTFAHDALATIFSVTKSVCQAEGLSCHSERNDRRSDFNRSNHRGVDVP